MSLCRWVPLNVVGTSVSLGKLPISKPPGEVRVSRGWKSNARNVAMPKDNTLAGINARLDGTGVRLLQRGQSLYLRATLPRKPGTPGRGNKQYDLSLRLKATPRNMPIAEAKAQELASDIALQRFEWGASDQFGRSDESLTTAKLISKFEWEYKNTHNVTDETWVLFHYKYFKRLPQEQELTAEALLDVALNTNPNTFTRKHCCRRLQALADFAGIEVDLLKYQGNYGPQLYRTRELPTDEEIIKTYNRIKNKGWRWYFGVVAAFGLRPSEPFFLDPSKLSIDQVFVPKVKKSSAGARIARPLPPSWAQEWQLDLIQLPNIKATTPSKYARKACAYFTSVGIGFTPKTLRHCYAVRAHTVYHLPAKVASQMMGHSPEEHLKTYQRWITDAQVEAAYLDAIKQTRG
jgi:integrase